MIRLDKNALVCDLAETYHIYDYRGLPCRTVAVLSSGLGENSRIRSKANGLTVSLSTFLTAVAVDNLRALCWLESGAKKSRRPESLAAKLLISNSKPKHTYRTRTMDGFKQMYAEKYGRVL